ncbi:MAG: type II secretion system protein [Kiritimatiellae bacterium]|nr:type II secretion system protein [Kiritimatiellia bacterium]
MKIRQNRVYGFTLVELLLVIAILSIVSTLAVTHVGNLRAQSARKVSVSNQQAIGRAVDSYLTVNNGQLNRLDSLLDMGTPDSSGDGFNFQTFRSSASGSVGYLYCGPDDMGNPPPESIVKKNSGLTSELQSVLAAYSLSKAEAEALHRLGLMFLMRHTTFAQQSPASVYGNKGGDGVYLPTDETVGLDPARSACVAQMVSNGMVCASVSPLVQLGRDIYKDCGQEILKTEQDESSYSESAVKAEVVATGGPLLAFGLGENASIVGNAQGGMEAVPYSEVPLRQYYRQYILLFRLRPSPAGTVEAEFAGVLDPFGYTIRRARLAVNQ